MISVPLARRLRDSGVKWEPHPGDRFVVADRDMDDQVFTVADMSVNVQEFTGGRVLGFNGTLEWALDSIQDGECVWLPGETQLRELLAGTFRSLTRVESGWRVDIEINGQAGSFTHDAAAEAYGLALLHLVTGS